MINGAKVHLLTLVGGVLNLRSVYQHSIRLEDSFLNAVVTSLFASEDKTGIKPQVLISFIIKQKKTSER